MPRIAKELRGLQIDEVSLVDRGAGQGCVVTIAKSASGMEEEDMDIFDEQGNPLDPSALAEGDIVYGEDGQAYVFTAENEDEEVEEKASELEMVGKSNPFRREETVAKSSSFAEEVRTALSKALTDDDRDAVISKALGRIDELAEVAKRAEVRAEQERDLRLDREYTEIAKAYNVPVQAEVLGPVLKRAAEALSEADCRVIAKCLSAAGEATFDEIGSVGGGSNSDVFREVEALVDSTVSKSASNLTREEAISKAFSANPDAYEEYLREQRA